MYRKYSTRVCVLRLIQHQAKPSAVFASRHPRVLYFLYTQARRCFEWSLYYFLVVWFRVIFSSTQTAVIFGDQDISQCLYNLIQNSQAVKKECGPEKGYGEIRCEIQGGGQEMAVMVG